MGMQTKLDIIGGYRMGPIKQGRIRSQRRTSPVDYRLVGVKVAAKYAGLYLILFSEYS